MKRLPRKLKKKLRQLWDEAYQTQGFTFKELLHLPSVLREECDETPSTH